MKPVELNIVLWMAIVWCTCSENRQMPQLETASQRETTLTTTIEGTVVVPTGSIHGVSVDSPDTKTIPTLKSTILECALANKHFNARKWLSSDRTFPSPLNPGTISEFDPIIKKMARRYGFDWRLIAAQIFVESAFDSSVESGCGARGLMQIMPRTSQYLGFNPQHLKNPEVNIAIGCLYNFKLFHQWKKEIDMKEQRLAFSLASFNAGRARVLKSIDDSARTWERAHPALPLETQNYVHRIALKQHEYSRFVLP